MINWAEFLSRVIWTFVIDILKIVQLVKLRRIRMGPIHKPNDANDKCIGLVWVPGAFVVQIV